jgi:hypothetical protein
LQKILGIRIHTDINSNDTPFDRNKVGTGKIRWSTEAPNGFSDPDDLDGDRALRFVAFKTSLSRVLRSRKKQKPIALFIDDAHDLYVKTLVGLKRLIEVVQDGNGTLSVVLAGHPKLKNDLRRPRMEEIGSRAAIFDLEGFGGEKLELSQMAARAMP